MAELISIILPTYNGSKYIRQSIDSCLKQTYENFELIIVNDCSTDNTLDIITEYAQKDKRIKIINNEVNKKLPLSLNAGFDNAQGVYYTWTSDDNYYAPDAIEVMHRELQSNPDTDLVYAGYVLIDEHDKHVSLFEPYDVNDSFFKWLGCGACFMYKAEIHNSNKGYNPSAFLIEDYDFFVRAFAKYKFRYINNTKLYYYRTHPLSLTATYAQDAFNMQKTLQERYIGILSPKIGEYETLLLYRKLAVYYAVHNNNLQKTTTYLSKIYPANAGMAFITIFYIIFKKLVVSLKIVLSLFVFLFKLPFSKNIK